MKRFLDEFHTVSRIELYSYKLFLISTVSKLAEYRFTVFVVFIVVFVAGIYLLAKINDSLL